MHDSIYANENPWGYKSFPYKKRISIYVREEVSQFIEEISEYIGDGPKGDMWNKRWIVNLDLDFFWDENKIKYLILNSFMILLIDRRMQWEI